MPRNDKTVLFITPGASLVGGNVFLVNFLKWMKLNSPIPFVTVYGHGGELEQDLKSLGPAYNHGYDSTTRGLAGQGFRRIKKHLKWRERYVRSALRKYDIGLIYSNAVTNDRVLSNLSDLDVPVISHCHELESHIQRMGIDGFDRTKARTDLFVAVSEAVRKNLVCNHAIPAEKIELIYEFIPVSPWSNDVMQRHRANVFQELALPENAFVIGGSGTLYWRKAPDLFIQIAAKVRRTAPELPIYFLWVGGARKGDFVSYELNYDAKKLGIADRVFFIEHTTQPSEYFAAIDVFAMVSREDPFPLVCLETASMGKPVICFADAGGMPEFVGEDCGFMVPYADTDAFAEKIKRLFSDREGLAKLGQNASEKVTRSHDIKTNGPKVIELIERFMPT